MPQRHFPHRLLLHRVRRTAHERKYSPEGTILTHKKRYTGHATVHGLAYERHRATLHPQKPPHLIHRHKHHVHTGHKHKHTLHHLSAVQHQHRGHTTVVKLHESRHDAAEKAVATKRARGQLLGFARLTSAQRSVMAKKAAQTRKLRHESNFGHLSAAQKRLRAIHAAATRKREGVRPFAHESAATRHAASLRAAATRRARHEK